MISASSTNSPEFNRETAGQILGKYPALSHSNFDWQSINQGQANQAAQIIANGQTYLLKSLPINASKERQAFSTAVLHGLAESGFPCPQIMLNQNGEGLTEHLGQLFVVQTWLDGNHLSDDLQKDTPIDLAHKLGQIVGLMHSTLENSSLPSAPDNAQVSVETQIGEVDNFITQMFSGKLWRPSPYWRLRLKPGKTIFDETLISSLLQIQQVTKHLKTWIPGHQKNLALLSAIHGDLNWNNILMTKEGNYALIDFDNAQMQPLACELAAALAILCPWPGKAQNGFLAGYSSQGMPIPDKEIIYNLMLLKYVRSLAWQIYNWHQLRNQKPEMKQWILFLTENLNTTWNSIR